MSIRIHSQIVRMLQKPDSASLLEFEMKRLAVLLFCLLLLSASVFASPSLYLRGAYLFSYDTNVYSDPMVRNAGDAWLNWRAENPYIKRFNNGRHEDFDVFFSNKGRTGLSISYSDGFAFKETIYKPEMNGSSWADWDYKEYNTLSTSNIRLFLGIGPIFRAVLGPFDLGIAFRGSVGSFDIFKNSVIVGLQAELYSNLFITENFFMTFGMLYDAHLMEYYLNNSEKWYNADYTMLTAGAYIGLGYKIGGRGE